MVSLPDPFVKVVGPPLAKLSRRVNGQRPADPAVRAASDARYRAIRELGDRYHSTLTASPDLTRFEFRVFSQNGEDGVIAEILHRVGATSFSFVEFGIDGGAEGNCVFLADVLGWNGLFMEAGEEPFLALQEKYQSNDRVQCVRASISPANIDEILAAADVPQELDVLSIDVDGDDYWIWEAMTYCQPRLVLVEYNSSLDPSAQLVKPPGSGAGWDGTDYFGASLGALRALAARKGYTFVHTDLTGTNAFFVLDSLADRFPELTPPSRPPNYPDGGRHRRDPLNRPYTDVGPGAQPPSA